MKLIKNDIIAWFNSYLRNRMDFLADIATGEPVMEVTKMLMGDVISGLDRNRILMNHISGVERFKYTIQIRDCRNCENCEQSCDPIHVRGSDIPVSMPNDVMGFHALYIIIENVIRNTAKHSGSSDETVKFTLEVKECKEDKSLYHVCLYDSVEIKGKVKPKDKEQNHNSTIEQDDITIEEEEKKKYGNKTGNDFPEGGIKKVDWLVYKQNCHINNEVLDPETGSLRQGALGMIEMKVSAAYLRKLSAENIDNEEYKLDISDEDSCAKALDGKKPIPNILKAVNKDGCLGYMFHLMKPKEMIVVDEGGELYKELSEKIDGENKSKIEILKDYGIWVLHNSNNLDKENRFDENEVYPHPFILVIPKDGVFQKEIYLRHKEGLFKGNLPTRILVKGEKPKEMDEKDLRWVAWFYGNEIIEALEQPKVIRKTPPQSISDLKDEHIMDKVWKMWLQNKVDFFGIKKLKTENSTDESINVTTSLSQNFEKYIFLNKSDNNEFEFNFWLDYHGDHLPDVFKDEKCSFDHYEAYSSTIKNQIEKGENDKLSSVTVNPDFDKSVLYKIIEGILSKVLIVDERVQQAYKEDGFKGKKKEILYKAANIHIPSEIELDLNKVTYETNYKGLLISVLERVKDASVMKGIDFIVIHLGVIEKMLTAQGKSKEKPQIEDFILSLTESSKAKVLITTGRGKPDNLPEGIPFLSFSTLSQYAIEIPFKSFLNQSVQSARLFN